MSEHSRNRKRVSKARKRGIQKDRRTKREMMESVLRNEDSLVDPVLNPLEKTPAEIIEDGTTEVVIERSGYRCVLM